MEYSFIETINNHKKDAQDYIEVVNKLTLGQTQTLDNLVDEIVTTIRKPDYEIEIEKLQEYYLKISSELYLMVDKLKQFEIYSSLAKSNESETYNFAYLEETKAEGKKPAVEELKIRAGVKTQKASLVNTVYASAYKIIKSKIDAGNNIADTLKNIIKVRTSLEFTTNQSNNNKGVF